MTDPTPTLNIDLSGPELTLTFTYNPHWVAALQRLRLRHFDSRTRAWHVPWWLAPELVAALENVGVPPEALTTLRALAREQLAESAAEGARALAAYERAWPKLAETHPDLFAHQREGVGFLLRPRALKGAILADDMGLGKSRQAILAADLASPTGRILVVCPAGVKWHWAREIRLALGDDTAVSVIDGAQGAFARWTVINYDLLKRHRPRLFAAHWGSLIVDEAHYIKNRHAQRTQWLIGGVGKRGVKIQGLVERASRVMLLTGTPLTNRPLDLFPLLRAIRHPLGDDVLTYALKYCGAYQNAFGWDMNGASDLEGLHAELDGVMLRRTKEEVLDLPPKLRTYMPVSVDLVAYRQAWRDYAATLSRKKRRNARAMLLTELTKLRQSVAIAKIPAAKDLVTSIVESGQKVVVFSCFQAVVDGLMVHFGASAVRVTGSDDACAREAAVTAFQHDDAVRVFVGNIQAAGTGISLTAATQVVFVDYSYVPAEHQQAEDRPYRIGQTQAVTVTYLSARDTIDDDIEALLAQKLGVVAQAIDGVTPLLVDSFLDDLLAVVARNAG